MRVITIDEGKKEKMSEYAEKMLKYGGKLMQCIESLNEEDEDESMGERYGERYGERGVERMGRGGNYGARYGERYGERDDDEMDDEEDFGMRGGGRDGYGRRDGMGMRRSRRTGRYIR